MKIKKLCTYENIQLENVDGSKPRGSWARLQKTFTEAHFDITLLPGIGVKLVSKDDGEMANHFVIPFANIPYLVTEHDDDKTEGSPIRRRRRQPQAVQISIPADQESEDSDD